MIRILHAADLHLDSPFAALSPSQAARRREEQRALIRRLAAECEARDCELLLLAGDLFDSDRVYRETAELLCRTLGSLRARVFIAPGNHDPWSPASPYALLDWPENVHIFRSRRIEAVRIPSLDTTIWGAAFTSSRETGLFSGFRAEGRGVRILLIHGTLGDPGSVYNPISPEEAAASGLDYLALGHVHSREVRRLGRTTVVNPGCAMGRGFDETGPKGAVYTELEGADCRVFPVELGAREYRTLSVRAGDDPLSALEAALPEDAAEHIYRVTLTGPAQKPDMEALREALAPRCFALELIDATQPPPELWRDLNEDSLKGEFLRQLKACYDGDETAEARRLVVHAAELGLALMEGREVPEP